MSNLKISYADIPAASLVIDSTRTFDEDFPVDNLLSGKRGYHSKLAAAAATYQLTFDLGASNDLPADHLIVARADATVDNSVTDITLSADSTDAFSSPTTVYASSSWDSHALTGPDSTDAIETFTQTSDFRYWRFYLETSGTNKFAISKLYFGSFWEPGVDVEFYNYQAGGLADNDLNTAVGESLLIQTKKPLYSFSFQWSGVTDALVQTFVEKILNRPQDGVFLYETGNDQILADFELVHCLIQPSQTVIRKVKSDYNTIQAVFTEMLG